jgi:hypothetical protein
MRCASLANADTSASPPEAAPKCGGGPDIGRSGALSARHPAHAVGAEVEAAPAVHAQFPRRRPLGPTQRGALAASLDVRIGEVQDHCDRRRHESPADHLPFGASRRLSRSHGLSNVHRRQRCSRTRQARGSHPLGRVTPRSRRLNVELRRQAISERLVQRALMFDERPGATVLALELGDSGLMH